MTVLKCLTPDMYVAGQITAADVAAIRAAGIVAVINNRPDGEEPGQPPAAEVAAFLAESGLPVRHIPIHGMPTLDEVAAVHAACEAAGGPVLAFCRSGTRSTVAWALARLLHGGGDPEEVFAQAQAAGYDLRRYLG